MAGKINSQIEVRQGQRSDGRTAFEIFNRSLHDLMKRLGIIPATSQLDLEAEGRSWKGMRLVYEHLYESADQFWLAEQAGRPVGMARSMMRENVRELTEFFVLPEAQSGGIGRELLKLAFPLDGTVQRIIIATPDPRAQALYMKLGIFPRSPIYYFSRKPEIAESPSDLTFVPISQWPGHLSALGEIDRNVLGYTRAADHEWFLGNRPGYFYLRASKPVGYGYVGKDTGPFAALDVTDYPAILAHAEASAARQGYEEIGLEVPMANTTAAQYLLGRGYHIGPFIAYLMSDRPAGDFSKYIITRPMFFL